MTDQDRRDAGLVEARCAERYSGSDRDERWSSTSHAPVLFHWERNAEGDAFIGYRMKL